MKDTKFKIYATISGWLVPVEIIKETRAMYYLKDKENKEFKLSKKDKDRALFDDVWQAQDWINEYNPKEN